MRNTDYFKNKKVTVVGLGRSGLAAANLLYDLGAQVSVTDNQDTTLTRLHSAKLKSAQINCEIGKHTREYIMGKDLVVVSPGVSDEALPLVWAKECNIPVISEIEVAWILSVAVVIAVTGTNGKTTVTTLIGEILKEHGRVRDKTPKVSDGCLRQPVWGGVYLCGNIGEPFCNVVDKLQMGDFVVLEVSSFQLEKIQTFKPKIAIMLNFSRNHLDRYKDMSDYLAAKKRIFMNQDTWDYLILNAQDAALKELAKEARAKVVFFSETDTLNPNQAACLAASSILGIEEELVLSVFEKFKGVEHRMELVGEINNIKFINDSKATTVDATVWALKNTVAPVILIAGGREKGNDYRIILDLVRRKVKAGILIGEAKERMEEAFKEILPLKKAETLPEAVRFAFEQAKSGDCILFSPMCKSFDMFSDYAERGRVFKQAVGEIP